MLKVLNNVIQLLLPELCPGCNDVLTYEERPLCLQCRHNLPLSHYTAYQDNPVSRTFHGRLPLCRATSLLLYKKGIVREIMYKLKYKGKRELGGFFGQWLGTEMAKNADEWPVDLIVPVPLHPSRLRKRGYNQVTDFGATIARKLNATLIEDVLYRGQYTSKLAFQGRLARWKNLEHSFALRDTKNIEGKHILLVDDILTTGATLEYCGRELLKAPGVKLSIAVICSPVE